MIDLTAQTHYEILGVLESADLATIRGAYKELIKLFHPDRLTMLSKDEQIAAGRRAAEINRAYEVLGNPQSRRRYDQELADARRAASTNGRRQAPVDDPGVRAWNDAMLGADARDRREQQEHVHRMTYSWAGANDLGSWSMSVSANNISEESMQALLGLVLPRVGADLEIPVRMTRRLWAGEAVLVSTIDGFQIPLQHAEQGTYRFPGRGHRGLNGGPRGTLFVQVVHVDDHGRRLSRSHGDHLIQPTREFRLPPNQTPEKSPRPLLHVSASAKGPVPKKESFARRTARALGTGLAVIAASIGAGVFAFIIVLCINLLREGH